VVVDDFFRGPRRPGQKLGAAIGVENQREVVVFFRHRRTRAIWERQSFLSGNRFLNLESF